MADHSNPINYDPGFIEEAEAAATSIRIVFAQGYARRVVTRQIQGAVRGVEVLLAALGEIYGKLPVDDGVKTLTLTDANGNTSEHKDTEGEQDAWLGDYVLSYEIFDCFKIDLRMFPRQEAVEEEIAKERAAEGRPVPKAKIH